VVGGVAGAAYMASKKLEVAGTPSGEDSEALDEGEES
jgi:hypothetical protein